MNSATVKASQFAQRRTVRASLFSLMTLWLCGPAFSQGTTVNLTCNGTTASAEISATGNGATGTDTLQVTGLLSGKNPLS